MRHPAAPTVIAVLLGFLLFMVLWSQARGDGHHEGNPHPNDVPRKDKRSEQDTPCDDEDEAPRVDEKT